MPKSMNWQTGVQSVDGNGEAVPVHVGFGGVEILPEKIVIWPDVCRQMR